MDAMDGEASAGTHTAGTSSEGDTNAARGDGLRKALRRAGPVLAFGVAPVIVLAAMFQVGITSSSLAVDLHYELYPQAKELLSGGNPFPGPDFEPLVGGNPVWPPLATALVAPLTVLPLGSAEVVMGLLGLALFATALWLVGVRDWRVFGACALWPQVAGEMRVTHLTPVLALLLAASWRMRDRSVLPGAPIGLAIALKLFLWPVAVWVASLRRPAAFVLACAVAAASLVSVLPYVGLDDYVSALERLGRYFDQDAYTVYGLLTQLHVADVPARLVQLGVGVVLLAAMWRLRSFSLAVAAALALSPIVWLDYFALAAVPLAVVKPRLSVVWLLPLLSWGAQGTGIGIGDPVQIARVFIVFAAVLGIAAVAERSAVTDSNEPAPIRNLGSMPSVGRTASGGTR